MYTDPVFHVQLATQLDCTCFFKAYSLVHIFKVFLTSGLGGMSGAQAKAAVICGCVGVIAEVN